MNYPKGLYLLILFVLSSLFRLELSGQTSQYRFRHIDISNGLSQNTINDIFQDSDGYIWIATQDGLNRYDGYEVKQYLPSSTDSTSISDNFLWNITEDGFGNLWMCSRNAANRFNRKTGMFTKFYTDRSYSPNSIAHQNGQTYILAGGEIYETPSNAIANVRDSLTSFSKVQLDERLKGPFTIFNLKNEQLAIIGRSGVLFKEQGQQKFSQLPFEPGPFVTLDNRVVMNQKGDLLLGLNNGIYIANPSQDKIRPYLADVYNGPVHALAFGPRGNLWISTDEGLKIIDPEQRQLKDFNPLGENSAILKSEIAFSIFKGNNDILWVGTSNNGLYIYDKQLDQFKFINAQNGLRSEMIWSIAQVGEQYWLGTENGVVIMDIKPNTPLTSVSFLPESINIPSYLSQSQIITGRVNMIYAEASGSKMIGVHSDALYVVNRNNRLIKVVRFGKGDPIANQITSVVKHENEYWVTTFKGIYILDEQYNLNREFTHRNLSTGYFFQAYGDPNGVLWFGANTGFYKYESSTDRLVHYAYQSDAQDGPGFYFVNGFAKAKERGLWLATFGGGLDYFDPVNESYRHYTTENGLANNVVSSIQADEKGHLWLGTNRGISRFNPSDSSFINFNTEDGIVFNEMAINSSFKNKNGELLFGTAGGLVVFHPDSINTNALTPKPKFTGFQVNYEQVKRTISDGTVIDIYPNDKVLTFEFASLTYRNTERIIYEFKIAGIDDQWGSTDANNRRATYSTLPFGTHTLQVRAKNIDGSLSEVAEVILVVHPPLLLTWWFIVLLSLFTIAVVILSVRRFFKNRMKAQLRELEMKQKIQAERERISRDLHDNVGSQITHIISSLDNMSYQSRQSNGENQQLEDLSDFARSTMHHLRETIWVVNKDAIRLDEFVDKARDHASRVLEYSDKSFSVRLNGAKDYMLNPSVAMNLFRVFQEGFNNAVKHASASKIETIFLNFDHRISMTLKDNGIGFNGSKREGHYGIANMEDRVREMNGKFEISSSEKGTSVRVEFMKNQSTTNA